MKCNFCINKWNYKNTDKFPNTPLFSLDGKIDWPVPRLTDNIGAIFSYTTEPQLKKKVNDFSLTKKIIGLCYDFSMTEAFR